ncbi:hypothetical protein Dimus_030020 [Dionaea muscipula]
MTMEDQGFDEMDSLFEGMVLFTPSQTVDNDGSKAQVDLASPVKDNNEATAVLPSSSSSEPLDENLFSDLTVINLGEAQGVVLSVQPDPIPIAGTITRTRGKSVSRQISRKKKRTSVRIGYGRDVHPSDDHLSRSNSSESLSLDGNSLSTSETSVQPDLKAEEEDKQVSYLSSNVSAFDTSQDSHSNPLPHENRGTVCSSGDMIESPDEQLNADDDMKSTEGRNDVSGIAKVEEENGVSAIAEVKEEMSYQEQERGEDEEALESFEALHERIKMEISKKLRHAKESAASISMARKESRRRRRKASEDVDLASLRYRELEKQLDQACEAEEFEMAESLSESLAAAEKETEDLLKELRDADADCDAIDTKMQEALEHQIAVEEECLSLMQHFSEDAATNADLVLQKVELNSSKEMDEWFSTAESLEVKNMELEIQSHLVEEARSGLDSSIDHLVEDEVREKEVLCKKKKLLAEELEKLLALVRQKEAELVENDSEIKAVDKRIAEVVSSFEDMRSRIVAQFDDLQSELCEIQSQNEALSNKQKTIDKLLSEEKERGAALRKLAMESADVAKTYEENLVLRKELVLSIVKSREEKIRLSSTEEKVLSDIQVLRQEIAAARSSLQELSSQKSRIQQEIESSKQRIMFIDKRIPELEAEKKVAAAARNFKKAALIAAEAKTLSSDREHEHVKMEQAGVELRKLEEEIKDTDNKVDQTEGTILLKEREAAVARFQRLNVVTGAALAENAAALVLGDPEEARMLLAEAEAAQSEAKEIQSAHGISVEDLECLPTNFISMELVSTLDGPQLANLASKYFSFIGPSTDVVLS